MTSLPTPSLAWDMIANQPATKLDGIPLTRAMLSTLTPSECHRYHNAVKEGLWRLHSIVWDRKPAAVVLNLGSNGRSAIFQFILADLLPRKCTL